MTATMTLQTENRTARLSGTGAPRGAVNTGGDRTLGRLWDRYLDARAVLCETEGEMELHRARKLRDRLVVNYSPLVKYVAGRLRTGTDREEVFSWGMGGLLHAVETYDPFYGAKFETYAISKIRWAIIDELRRQDWVPRRVRTKAQQIEKQTARLAQRLGRTPTEAEAAEVSDMTIEKYREFTGKYAKAQVSSLEARLEVDERVGGDFHAVVTDLNAINPQEQADKESIKAQLVEAISELGEQERLVATFYYYEGLTLKEIGKALGLTEGRISQILRRALDKLRAALRETDLAAFGF